VREAARIQTLPDGFRFLGPHSEQPLQVANVVPFQLGRAIARTLMHALRRPEAR
jgi:DNA (cytosine-5)-methyltransferase 1